MNYIHITKKKSNNALIDLTRILEILDQQALKLQWTLLELEAISDVLYKDGMNQLDFENYIMIQSHGYFLNWNDFVKISKNLFQAINLKIAGYESIEKIKKQPSKYSLLSNALLSLELVDSSFYKIGCNNEDQFHLLKKEFEII